MARPRKITPECERVAAELLARRLTKGTIKLALAQQFKLGPRSIETVLARVREAAIANFQRPKAEHQGEAIAFYETVIRDPKAKNADKIRAQERIDWLLGLSAQFRTSVELSGPDGQAIQVAQTSAVLFLPTLEEDPVEPKNGNGNGHLETTRKEDSAPGGSAMDLSA